jgi:AcrR family transcriptional regulator
MTQETAREERNARERILQSAIDLFSQRGYEGLYQTLVDETLKTYRHAFERAWSTQSTTLEQLAEIVRLQLDFCQGNQKLIRFIYTALCTPPPDIPLYDFDRFYNATLEALRAVVVRGIERGELQGQPIEEVAVVLLGIINIYAMNQIFGRGVKISRETIEKTVQILYRGITQKDRKDT